MKGLLLQYFKQLSTRFSNARPGFSLPMNLKVGRVCPQVGIAGTKGDRACCPQHAANVSRHSYKLRAEDRHALPPNGKIFEKWRDSHVYVSSAPGAQDWFGRSDRCRALVVSRGAL